MRRRAVLALIGAALAAGSGAAGAAPRPRVLPLGRPDPRFGGLSALHLGPGGARALLLSDRGVLFEAALDRDAAGAPLALRITAAHRLRGSDGRPLPQARADAEALALLPDGTILVGFEGQGGGRILSYAFPGAPAARVAVPHAFADFPPNGGIEAMAAGPDGALWVIPEAVGDAAAPVWRRRPGGGWAVAGELPLSDGWRPVAADVGPDGALWVLDRRLRAWGAFGARLRRSEGAGWRLVLLMPDGRHGNLEGLSLWRDPAGRLVAGMVSDDNFRPFQRSELVEYLVDG